MNNNLNLLIDENINYVFLFEKDFINILNVYCKVMDFKKNVEVDVLITNNQTIKKISNQYRNIDKETDVLSFPFSNSEKFDFLSHTPLGEIVLSFEKIENQAREFNHSIRREFCFLFAHGLVHLAGYDHKNHDDEKNFNNFVYNIMDQVDIKRK